MPQYTLTLVCMVETLTVELPSVESAIALTGTQENNLKTLAKQTGATLVMRGQELFISGTKNQIDLTQRLVQALEGILESRKTN